MQNILSQNHLIAIYLFNFVTTIPAKCIFHKKITPFFLQEVYTMRRRIE